MSIRLKAILKKTTTFLVVFLVMLFGIDVSTREALFDVFSEPVPVEQDAHEYSVVRVIDGDTVRVLIDGREETLRLIGINTPEVVDPRRPIQCFGEEASERAKEILSNARVFLEDDPTQSDRDKYGRLLRYILLPDGTNFNRKMIEEGYAYEYTYDVPYRYQFDFKEAEHRARELGRGLWSKEACGGKSK